MRTIGVLGFVAWTLIVVSTVVLAQEEEKGARRVILKPYSPIGAAELYRAIGEDVRADVRFVDEFDSPVQLTDALRLVRLDDRRVRIGAAFRTESDLCCLVPLEAREQLEKLRDLRKGQSITVEGTVLGNIEGYSCVLADMVLTGTEKESVIHDELLLEWPGPLRVQPKLITQPGSYVVEFPCRWKRDAVEKVVVAVEQRGRAEFLAELKEQEKAAVEEKHEEEKVYKPYKPSAVYDYARDDVQIDVSFQDNIKGPTPRSASLETVRLVGRRHIRIGYSFETYGEITCLVPAPYEDMLERARRAIRGQDVIVKGTIVGRLGTYRAVLVDELEFPAIKDLPETPHVWIVEIAWGDERPTTYWRQGTYTRLLPCKFVQGRGEQLDITLRQVRLVGGREEGQGAKETGEGEQPAGSPKTRRTPAQGPA